MTFLDVVLTFAVIAIVLLVVSVHPIGGQFATGFLGTAILIILLNNAGKLQTIEQNTLGRLGAAGKVS